MELLTPTHFPDYELIDCGNFEKMERFGKYITIRPEPQAVWDPKLSRREWEKTAHVIFESRSSSSGTWRALRDMPERWVIEYPLANQKSEGKSQKVANEPSPVPRPSSPSKTSPVPRPSSPSTTSPVPRPSSLSFRLALTSFKHVGIFPEQACNWDYIAESISSLKTEQPKVLNLFAYTGGASLAAKAAGADTIHLDSVKQVVTWARENMELSKLSDIRWVVEDALTFVKREVKRGKKYQGIILDPPAYGHGTDGERWKLEDSINEMMKLAKSLLDEQEHFLILNTYSLGFSSLIIENLLSGAKGLNTGELYLQATSGHKLPLGVFGRYMKSIE